MDITSASPVVSGWNMWLKRMWAVASMQREHKQMTE
jgi:hypothetical protein